MVLFKDIHKRVDDLLTKDWVHGNAVEVENNWKAADFTFKNKASVTGGVSLGELLPTLSSGCPAMTGACGTQTTGNLPSSQPVTITTEIGFDQPSANYNFKFDSVGNSTKELKLKNLYYAGLTLNNKVSFKSFGCSGYEAVAEYTAGGVHSQLTVNPCASTVALNAAYQVDKFTTVGGDISGPVSLAEGPASFAQNLKVGLSGSYGFPSSAKYGESRVGVKGSHEMSSNKSHFHAYLAVKQNKTESAVHLTQQLHKTANSPSLVFVTKHEVSKEVSVKAAITDALAVKTALYYKASSLLNASIGVGFDQKSGAKGGFKLAFNQ